MLWAVAIGGAAGSAARFLVGGAIQRASGTSFPVWTLVINVAGSLLLGFIMRYAVDGISLNAQTRALLTTGFCGGFTTFSTFSFETVSLIEQGDWRRAAIYIILSVGACLIGAFAGVGAAQALANVRGLGGAG